VPTYNTGSTPSERLNYTKSYSSWSVGALYKATDTTNVFVRVSSGGRFNADRLLYNDNNFTSDGKLTAGGDHLSVNTVTQQELGVKHTSHLGDIRLHGEATLYRAQVKESNYDFTAISRNQNPFIDTVYHASGVELSGSVAKGRFSMNGYVVYTDAKDAISHKTAFAMPKWTWMVSPTYDAGVAAIGLSATGQSSFYLGDMTTQAPGSTFVNGFVKVRPMAWLEIGFNVNNLFNTLGFRANNGSLDDRAGDGAGRQSGDLRQFGHAGPHDDGLGQVSLLTGQPCGSPTQDEKAGTEGQLPARLFHGANRCVSPMQAVFQSLRQENCLAIPKMKQKTLALGGRGQSNDTGSS
jgi:outer membrane receptor protein involved in Fe transport